MAEKDVKSDFLEEFVHEITTCILASNVDDPAVKAHCRDLAKKMKRVGSSPKNPDNVSNSVPACRHLGACYDNFGVPKDARLVELIRSVDHEIAWTDGYSEQTSDSQFLDNFAFSEIVGRSGIFYNEEVSIGFLLMGPNLYYPWHYHPAVELYYTLNGPTDWGIDGGELLAKEAGSLILHPTMVTHATRTSDKPLLAPWFWTGDTLTPPMLS